MQRNQCLIVDHNQGRINTVCFDTQCEGIRVCCQKCLLQLHSDHVDQIIDSDEVLSYIKTQSEKPIDLNSLESQVFFQLGEVQICLNALQKLVQSEKKRLATYSSQQVCKDIGNRYNIVEYQVQGLENSKLNQLAQEMLKSFDVKNGNLISKFTIIDSFGEFFTQFTKQFQQTLAEIKMKFETLNYIIENKGKKAIFDKFTQNSLLFGHTDFVCGIDISKQRNLLVSGSRDNTVKLWNLDNNILIQTYKHSGPVYEVVFSNEGSLLAYGGQLDYSVKIVDINDLKKNDVIHQLHGHTDNVNRLTFSSDSKYLISGSDDQTVKIWDCQSMELHFQLLSESQVNGVALSPDDKIIASNSNDGVIRIWTFKNREQICSQPAHDRWGCGIQFSNDQKMLASCNSQGIIKLWSLDQLNQSKIVLIREFKVANQCIWSVLFSPCTEFLISICNQDSEIKVIALYTGEIVKLFKSKQQKMRPFWIDIAISKKMDIIAYGEDDNIVVWKSQ